MKGIQLSIVMTKNTSELVADVLLLLQVSDAWIAGVIYNKDKVVRVTRRYFKKSGFDNKRLEFVVNICRPNYYEREIIKRRNKEPFPLEYTKQKGAGK